MRDFYNTLGAEVLGKYFDRYLGTCKIQNIIGAVIFRGISMFKIKNFIAR